MPSLNTYRDLGLVASNKPMNVAITLHHDDAAVAAFEASLNDPASANYQHWLTPDQFQARFDAPAATLGTVRAFATRFGMQLYNPSGLGDVTLVSGTAAQVEKTFNVGLHRFLDTHGQRVLRQHERADGSGRTSASPACWASRAWSRCTVLRASPPGRASASAVSAPDCSGRPRSGRSTTSPRPTSDREKRSGSSARAVPTTSSGRFAGSRRPGGCRTSRCRSTGPTREPRRTTRDGSNGSWTRRPRPAWRPRSRRSASTSAPDLSLSTLATTLQTWASDPKGPHQTNASLGICEDNPALDGLLGPSQEASGFALAQAAVEGRAFFSSTGDTGAGCSIVTGVNGVTYGALPFASYPASDPNATGVGGTVVYTDGAAKSPKLVDEHAWDHTGGTRSDFIAQPAYQHGVTALQASYCASQPNGTPYASPTLCRGTSDVAALSGDGTIVVAHRADGAVEANGYDMVDVDPSSGSDVYADHFAEGGTSLSSPLWTGMWARVNAAHKHGPLGRANDTLYGIAAGPHGATAFHDVIEGANPLPATPGWDFPTGLGSPDITNIMKAADAGNLKPVHNVMPSKGRDPAPIQASGVDYGCPATFSDVSGDAASLPQSAPQLDILHGDVALSADASKIRAAITVSNLTAQVPEGWTSMDWIDLLDPAGRRRDAADQLHEGLLRGRRIRRCDGSHHVHRRDGGLRRLWELPVLVHQHGRPVVSCRDRTGSSRSTRRWPTWAASCRARSWGRSGVRRRRATSRPG